MNTAPFITPPPRGPGCRGHIYASLAGLIMWMAILIPACSNAQAPAWEAIGQYTKNVSNDTMKTYQIRNDTLFVTEAWQSGYLEKHITYGNERLYSHLEPHIIKRRTVYRLQYLKTQQPRVTEKKETVTRQVEVWFDQRQ